MGRRHDTQMGPSSSCASHGAPANLEPSAQASAGLTLGCHAGRWWPLNHADSLRGIVISERTGKWPSGAPAHRTKRGALLLRLGADLPASAYFHKSDGLFHFHPVDRDNNDARGLVAVDFHLGQLGIGRGIRLA